MKIFIFFTVIFLFLFACEIPEDYEENPNQVFILSVVATPTDSESITIKNGSSG